MKVLSMSFRLQNILENMWVAILESKFGNPNTLPYIFYGELHKTFLKAYNL